MEFRPALPGSWFVSQLPGLFSGDDEESRWRRLYLLFLEQEKKKGGHGSLKNGEKKTRKLSHNSEPGGYFNSRNRLALAEGAANTLPAFLLRSRNRAEGFTLHEEVAGSSSRLGRAGGSRPQGQPPARGGVTHRSRRQELSVEGGFETWFRQRRFSQAQPGAQPG